MGSQKNGVRSPHLTNKRESFVTFEDQSGLTGGIK